MQNSLSDYLPTIRREFAKRQKAYPKMLQRAPKRFLQSPAAQDIPMADFSKALNDYVEVVAACYFRQLCFLESAAWIIERGNAVPQYHIKHLTDIYRELQRELRMRKACYPRWVRFGRMDPDTAAREISEWQSLTDTWHQTHCPLAPHRRPRVDRKRT